MSRKISIEWMGDSQTKPMVTQNAEFKKSSKTFKTQLLDDAIAQLVALRQEVQSEKMPAAPKHTPDF